MLESYRASLRFLGPFAFALQLVLRMLLPRLASWVIALHPLSAPERLLLKSFDLVAEEADAWVPAGGSEPASEVQSCAHRHRPDIDTRPSDADIGVDPTTGAAGEQEASRQTAGGEKRAPASAVRAPSCGILITAGLR